MELVVKDVELLQALGEAVAPVGKAGHLQGGPPPLLLLLLLLRQVMAAPPHHLRQGEHHHHRHLGHVGGLGVHVPLHGPQVLLPAPGHTQEQRAQNTSSGANFDKKKTFLKILFVEILVKV